MSTQHSFETRLERYTNGDTIIQALGAYAPANPLITKAANTAFITSVNGAETSVTNTLNSLTNFIEQRQLLCFIIKDTNPLCIQRRLMGVHGYLKAELGDANAATRKVNEVLKKIRPKYEGAVQQKSFTIVAGGSIVINNCVSGEIAFNTGGTNLSWNEVGGTAPPVTVSPGGQTTIVAPSGSIFVKNDSNTRGGKMKVTVKSDKAIKQSKMEKTYTSLIQFVTDVLTSISGIGGGFVYSPPDANLSVANLTAVRDQLKTLNANITTAEGSYGNANRNRKTLFDGLSGMAKRIILIKGYLSSFPGGKNSSAYIEFTDAIKGV